MTTTGPLRALDDDRRLRRLIEPHHPLGRLCIAAGSLTVAIALVVPLLVVGVPAAAATQLN